MLTTYLLIFMLSTFIGLEVIKRVSPLLHTPLMSLTNAISAISVVGSIELTGVATHNHDHLSIVLGTIAITASFANVVGGYVITDRMLKMFKKREPAKAAGTSSAAAKAGN
jgi:NAD(P) transhydrogenase subunit alpha